MDDQAWPAAAGRAAEVAGTIWALADPMDDEGDAFVDEDDGLSARREALFKEEDRR